MSIDQSSFLETLEVREINGEKKVVINLKRLIEFLDYFENIGFDLIETDAKFSTFLIHNSSLWSTNE